MTYAETLASEYADIRRRLYRSGHREDDAPVCRDVRMPAIPKPVPTRVPFDDRVKNSLETQWLTIANETIVKYGVSLPLMLSDSRFRWVMDARAECWYRMRTEMMVGGAAVTYPWIGRKFNRDHTTVLSGVKRHCRRVGIRFPAVRKDP